MDERELNEQPKQEPIVENNIGQVNVQQMPRIAPVEHEEDNVEQIIEERPKSRRRILLLLLLLIATGFLLTTTTYAWFTSNRTVTVGDINVNVATSGGIQISVDAANWKSLVSTAELNAANSTYSAATNQIPATTASLQPVSTALTSLAKNTTDHEDPSDSTSPLVDKRNDDGYLSMWHGVVKSNAGGQYILTATDTSTVAHSTSTGYFVCFDLFFKVDAESGETTGTQKQIYLTTTSDVIANGADSGIKNAARVAFIKEGAVGAGSAAADAQVLKTTTISGNVYLWEPNYDKHTSSGVNNAVNVYGVTASTISTDPTESGKNAVLSYDGVIAAVTEANNITLGNATATAHSTQFAAIPNTVTKLNTKEGWAASQVDTADEGKFKQIFTLGVNQITKVKVYFWVEGQDVDCENNASGGSITLKLQFSLNDEEE